MTDARCDYDVLVIGAGPGGYGAAIRAAQLGLRTACVESRDTLGGTCLNVGCIPSKALLHASEVFEQASCGAWAKFGIEVDGARLNLDRVQAEKAKAVNELTGGIESLFRKNKVAWLKGRASFLDARTVRITPQDGQAWSVTAGNIVIATGSSVASLPGVALNGAVVVDSTGALALPRGAERLVVVVGGGVIGLELGSVWRRLGAQVTVLEYADQILPGFDGEVRNEAARLLRKQGMTIRTAAKVTGVTVDGACATVSVEPAAGGAGEALAADIVLVAIGRQANVEGLNLPAIGLIPNGQGQIAVDADFTTAVPGIWAIGDCVPGPMLAHKAEDDGLAVAEIIAGLPGTVNGGAIPSVVYTMPEIAGVGLTEAAKARSQVKVGRFPFAANSRAKANRDTDGFVKVIADAATDRVLGVWIVSSLAGTMITQAVQAMEFGATSEDVVYTCHAYPTHAEAFKEAALGVAGKPIHV